MPSALTQTDSHFLEIVIIMKIKNGRAVSPALRAYNAGSVHETDETGGTFGGWYV
jgi:hypothetical protein